MDHRSPGMMALALCLAACASSGQSSDTVHDMALAPDLAGALPDFSVGGVDLSSSRPPDLAGVKGDLAMSVPPDLAAAGSCSVAPQGDCTSGDKCTTHDFATTVCDPIGATARAALCTYTGAVDSCVAGDKCINEGTAADPGPYQCRAFCNTDADCGSRGGMTSYCDNLIGSFGFCTNPCNPIYPGSGCATGLGCYMYGAQHTDCRVAGTAALGGACTYNTDCEPGMACIVPAAGGSGKCRWICNAIGGVCFPGNSCTGMISGWTAYEVCCPNLGGC